MFLYNSGIYFIASKIDGKLYIGQSKKLNNRINDHFRRLRNNKHQNRHLQYAYNLYGKDNFYYEIIEYCDENMLSNAESFYISYLKTYNDSIGYNLKVEIGEHSIHSENTIKYMRSIKPCKIVYAFNINGKLIKYWDSIKLCASELKVNTCDVRRTISQKQRLCKGYVLNDAPTFRLRENKRKLNYKNLC
jgi:hypothetical protein